MPKYQATAYIRLSYTDDRSSESDSVTNQRKLIENFIERNPDIQIVSEKIDDGYSGIIFDRPAFKEMMQDITDGKINCVIVKDLSRLGREYIETGRYLRRVFPTYGVRFIAITDNIDTAHEGSGDDLTVSVKNIMNEAYCRDISIKTRTSLDIKRRNGDFVGAFPVYGYMKSEENKNLLVPDPYASRVVRDIFRMRLDGISALRIATVLNEMGILSPLAYKKNNGLPYAKHGYADKEDCKWSATTIIRILQDETYIGTLVQGKQGTPHYKIKQMEQRPSSEWIRVPDAHEPLIAKQDFELVQRIRRLDTRTSPKQDTVYLFSGVLICGCCGSRMTRKTNRVKGKEYHYYYCPTGKKHGCTNPVMLKEGDLVECVKDSLKGYIDNVSCLQAILDGIDQSSINQALANEYASHIAANEQQVEQALEFKARLYESLITGTISKEEYTDYMSIENQHLALNEFVSSMPESANAEVLEFIDNGYSGTNFERPKVQELIEMVRANKIDCIIVKDFSRFGRNSIETGYFIERVFPLFHTRFISINDNFDSDQHKGDTGGMDVAFKYLISEYYSRDMSIKTKSAKYAKMQRGEYQSKVCPYGYRKSADGRMEPNPETAAVVQLIFQLAATGIGAAAVTRELFKRGIPTPGEYKATHGQQYHDVSRSRGRWSSSTVLRILEDERYIGSYVIGRRAVIEVGGTRSRRKDRDKWFIIPDHHPAIVDKELFEKVQAVQRRFSLPTRKTREYPLKSKVYCGCCDHALSRIVQKRPFYMCRHSTADVNSRCRDVRADAAGLEEAVLFTLKKQLEILLPVHEDGTIHLEATAAKCSEYEKQLEALKDQKQALFERYLLGQIELDTYKSEKAVYDAEILKVKNAYAAVTAQAKLKREEQARQSSRQEIVHSIAEADVLTSELTDLLIEKVYVFPDNRIEIVYKVHDLFE